ncbi:unnamed protein product [Cladocopium goreaui]|uniref:Pentacotripeptide-repeat region of PRORP domain-containing protein n=1 Tax=Cladocopium goreaui TaxID=2562237 RepID=A0A9P1D9U1_9DINO|nr:unnamed protein product [Cladocopium goreaui]
MHSLIPLLVGSVTALVHNRTQDVLIRQHFVQHLNLTFVETKGLPPPPRERVSEASQTPDMPSPKDFVSLIFGLLAFILAISIHWFNEERSAKIEVLLTKGLEDCRSVDANHLNTENRGRLVHVQGRATGRVPIADAQFQDAVVHDCLKLQSTLEVLQWVPASGLMKECFSAINAVHVIYALNELARSKLPQVVLETLHEMQFHLSVALKAGDWQFTLHLLDLTMRWRVSPNVVCLNAALHALERSCRWKEALWIFQAVFQGLSLAFDSFDSKFAEPFSPFWNLHPDVVTFNTAISACAKGSSWLSSLEMFSVLCEQQLQADHVTFNSVLNAFGLTWRSSLDLLAQMGDSETAPDIISYNTCISSCGHWPVAVQLQQLATSNQLRLDIISYASAFDAVRSIDGLWWQVLWQLEAMSQDSMRPERVCLRSVINSCEKHGQWQRALGQLASFDDVRLARDFLAWSAATSVCATCGLWRDAFVLFEGIRQTSAGTSCNVVLNACERVSQWQRAIEVEATDDNPTVVSFSCVSSALEKAGEWHQALLLLGDMKDCLVLPNVITYSATISACSKGSQWQRAVAILYSIAFSDLLPDEISFNAAITACEKAGQWEFALELLEKMTEFILESSVISWSSVVSALENAKKWQLALAVLESMQGLSILSNSITVNAAISSCEKCSKWQNALHLFYSMQLMSIQRSEVSFNSAILACSRARQWQMTLELFDNLQLSLLEVDVMLCTDELRAVWSGKPRSEIAR